MTGLRAIWRSLRVAENLVTGAAIGLYISIASRLGNPPAWVPSVVRWWHRRLCRALGVRVRVSGQVAEHCLLVANHVSWLDVPVLGAQAELGFLSKAEVRQWPLLGWMAVIAGTLFIERGANEAGRVADQIREGIAQGRTLVIFPEGTTSDGHEVRRFHPRLFAVAQQPGMQIQPVAVAYRHGTDPAPDLCVAYVGDDTLAANLWRVVRHPDLVVEVQFLPPMDERIGEDRRSLASRARIRIAEALGLNPEPQVRCVSVGTNALAPVVANCSPGDPSCSLPTIGLTHRSPARPGLARRP